MGVIDGISYKVASKIGEKTNKTKEEINVMNYGLFMIIHTVVAILTTIIIGILIGKPTEMILITLVAASLKRYSGGVHATSANRCVAIGVITSIICTCITSVLIHTNSIIICTLFSIFSLCISFFVFYKNAPVGTKNKPLKNEKNRNRLRKKLFFMLKIYYTIISVVIIMVLIGNFGVKNLNLVYCVELGILLQTFALTKFGETSILKLDRILIYTNNKGE